MTCSTQRRAVPWQVAVTVATLLSSATVVRAPLAAESAPSTEQETAPMPVDPEARQLYEQALVHFRDGQLDEAIAKLQAAYRLTPAAELLYNLGQAYRRKGDCAQALAAYRRFLDTGPQGLARERALTRVLELQSCAAAPGDGTDAGVAPAASPPDGGTATPTIATVPPTPMVPLPLAAPPKPDGLWLQQPTPQPPPSSGWWRRHRVVLVLGAVAVVLASASGYFAWQSHLAADRVSQTFERGGTWTSTDADNERHGTWDQRLAIAGAVLGLGTGAVAAWAAWRGWGTGEP